MSAWGADSFDNDTACDWAYTLEAAVDLSPVELALRAAADGNEDFLDADVCCEALAASEVVARLSGNYGVRNSYTEVVDNWVIAHPQVPSREIIHLAQKAIDRVLGEQSELRHLWEDGGAAEWIAAVNALRDRLAPGASASDNAD